MVCKQLLWGNNLRLASFPWGERITVLGQQFVPWVKDKCDTNALQGGDRPDSMARNTILTDYKPCARSRTSAAFGVGATVILRWLCPVEFPTELQLERRAVAVSKPSVV